MPRFSRSGVYKILKRLRESGSALPKNYPRIENPENLVLSRTLEKNQEKSKEKHKKIGFRTKRQLWYWVRMSARVRCKRYYMLI